MKLEKHFNSFNLLCFYGLLQVVQRYFPQIVPVYPGEPDEPLAPDTDAHSLLGQELYAP